MPVSYITGTENIYEVPMDFPLDTKLMKNKGKTILGNAYKVGKDHSKL